MRWEGVPHLAEDGGELACGGARLVIPPGALPPGPSYQVVCERRLQPTLGLPELTSGGLVTLFQFEPEPEELRKPITVEIPFDPDARGSEAEIGILDPQSGLYATLPSVREGNRLRLTLPSGTYTTPDLLHRISAPASIWPSLPAMTLNQLLGSLVAASYAHQAGVLRDETRQIQVNFVATPGAPSHVPESYAGEVLMAAQQAWDFMTGEGWPRPDGWLGGFVVLTITDMGPSTGTKGATTRGVFGQPWVTINSRLTSGAQVATTTAHEMGHVFQRQVNTVFSLKWIDEAAAQWTAVGTLGPGADISMDIAGGPDFPTLSLPKTFGTGYDEDQAYAAGVLAIWLESVSRGSMLRIYEQLRDSYLAYLDARGTMAAASGRTVEDIVSQFGLIYWTQGLPVLRNVNLGVSKVPWQDASGAVVRDRRAALSSRRVDIPVSGVAATLPGRDLVVRAAGLGPGQAVYLYRDVRSCDDPNPEPQQVQLLLQDRPENLAGVYDTSTRCYRMVLLNWASADSDNLVVTLIAPEIQNLSPSSGSNTGGYPITITGKGFGTRTGQVHLSGFPMSVGYWSDTRVNVTMFHAGSEVGPWSLQLTTAEGARSNPATFTLTP